MKAAPWLELRGITKTFGAVRAVDGVDLDLYPGEVLGLAGDNAAGKSTLMKVIAGVEQPERGEMRIDGQAVILASPAAARQRGIAMVYQDLALADNIDVAGNVYLGREPVVMRCYPPFRVLDRAKMQRETRALLARLGISADGRQRAGTLSGGQRQAVAIARALAFDARCVILDEPTAALAPEAAERVLELVRQLPAHGASVIIISHRRDELSQVADRLVTMRRGRLA